MNTTRQTITVDKTQIKLAPGIVDLTFSLDVDPIYATESDLALIGYEQRLAVYPVKPEGPFITTDSTIWEVTRIQAWTPEQAEMLKSFEEAEDDYWLDSSDFNDEIKNRIILNAAVEISEKLMNKINQSPVTKQAQSTSTLQFPDQGLPLQQRISASYTSYRYAQAELEWDSEVEEAEKLIELLLEALEIRVAPPTHR